MKNWLETDGSKQACQAARLAGAKAGGHGVAGVCGKVKLLQVAWEGRVSEQKAKSSQESESTGPCVQAKEWGTFSRQRGQRVPPAGLNTLLFLAGCHGPTHSDVPLEVSPPVT